MATFASQEAGIDHTAADDTATDDTAADDTAADDTAAGEQGTTARAAAGQPARPRGRRLTAQRRRQDLLAAAVVEFAANGYHGTRTGDIAARAGVSQPYVYALFPDKRALFLASHDWAAERVAEAMEKASADATCAASAGDVLARAYRSLADDHPHQVLFFLQAHAAAAADPVIRASVRQRFIELVDLGERLHDTPREEVLGYVSRAMLGNVALALGLPPEYGGRSQEPTVRS